jgi:murein DD-endopeptidase MepM/ murein hydrolase activator NlpD
MDFIKLDQNGKYCNGDEDIVSNWYGHGAEVLAVADGVVSSSRNDFSESNTLKDNPDHPSSLATGNFISLKIDEGKFVFYEHLKPNSILVKPGQKVRKGEVIARVGFTGQSMGPHLHFHVANRDSSLGAEGLPFVFEYFEIIGSFPDFANFGNKAWTNIEKNSLIKNERPPSNNVIVFR